jgi:hypothetical protein
VRNCLIEGGPYYGILVDDLLTTAPTVEDCTIVSASVDNALTAVNGYGTYTRLDISGVENGFNVTANGLTIEDCYIHDLSAAGADPHYDCIQIDGNLSDIVIRHNTLINDHPAASSIMIDNSNGPIDNVLVDNNYCSGGAYTLYCDAHFSADPITNVRYTDNHIVSGDFGYTNFNGTDPLFIGNVDAVTLEPIGDSGEASLFSATLETGDTNASTSFRFAVPISGVVGNKIAVTLTSGVATSLSIVKVAIGKLAGTGQIDTTTTPVELTFDGGSSGFTGLTGDTEKQSDFVDYTESFNLDGEDHIAVIIDVGAPGGMKYATGVSGVTGYFKGGTSADSSTMTGGTPLTDGILYLVTNVATQAD